MGKIKIGSSYFKKSVVFWNALLVVCIYSIGFYDIQAMMGFLLIGSCAGWLVATESKDDHNHLWITFMPGTWFVLAVVGIVMGLGLLYDITIIKFNNWLDNDDEKNTK